MATVKIKFRPSSVDGREGTVYYQVIHGRVARQINTSCKLFPAEWSKRHSRIVIASSDEDRRQYLLRKHSASCVFFSPLFLPTFVASL